MSGKRRFGVSVPEDIVRDLDLLAEKLGMDRSSLVTEALKGFIHDKMHVLHPHYCKGALLIVSRSGVADKLAVIYEKYSDMIKSRMHHHCDDVCVDILIIEAESKDIMSLEKELRSTGIAGAKYIPLRWYKYAGEEKGYQGLSSYEPT